tara:strand:- start:985 stop:1137 length:153 start_codon:yes stop_codon:yes gene_type:complete
MSQGIFSNAKILTEMAFFHAIGHQKWHENAPEIRLESQVKLLKNSRLKGL